MYIVCKKGFKEFDSINYYNIANSDEIIVEHDRDDNNKVKYTKQHKELLRLVKESYKITTFPLLRLAMKTVQNNKNVRQAIIFIYKQNNYFTYKLKIVTFSEEYIVIETVKNGNAWFYFIGSEMVRHTTDEISKEINKFCKNS